MEQNTLRGWDYIVYTLIKNNFGIERFTLQDLYRFEKYFQSVYPSNLHVQAKLRQTVQHLRDKGLLDFSDKGIYRLLKIEQKAEESIKKQELVYLLSNEAMPGWVKIGRTNQIERRLSDLYNTSVPLPFKAEDFIETITEEDSRSLEKSLHNIIDTINPDRRKNTEARKREFFKMSTEEAKNVFTLVRHINKIDMKKNEYALV